jgi:hypothetical protein
MKADIKRLLDKYIDAYEKLCAARRNERQLHKESLESTAYECLFMKCVIERLNAERVELNFKKRLTTAIESDSKKVVDHLANKIAKEMMERKLFDNLKIAKQHAQKLKVLKDAKKYLSHSKSDSHSAFLMWIDRVSKMNDEYLEQ